jgi:hypothetical protein
MRKLLVAVLVLLILAVAADFAAARVFEDRITDALEREYRLDRRPVVQVRDFPFLPHLASGRFGTIDLAADQVRAEGVTAERVLVHLRDVRVPRGVLLGGRGQVTVGRADGRVELTEAELNRLLAQRLQGGAVAIGEDGVRVRVRLQVVGRTVDAEATGRLGASGGAITFTPDQVRLGGGLDPALGQVFASRFSFRVPLPALPAGVRLDRVDTRPGALVVTGRAAAVRLST